MAQKLLQNSGYSLFELVVVIVILSVLVTVSMRTMDSSVDVAKTEETKEELEQLAAAITGDPTLISGGNRIDYGYIGDIGALPNNLQDLVINPGLGTWDGPYVKDDFYSSASAAETEYLIDGWGQSYSYSGGVTISSTGGSTTITKELAGSENDLLYNSVTFNIVDFELCPPGSVNSDSVIVRLTYPNGFGGNQTVSKNPLANGFVRFDSIPIGQQTLSVIDLINNDSLTRKIFLNPNSVYHSDIQFPTSLWCNTTAMGGGAGLIYVPGSVHVSGGGCNNFQFDVQNNSTSDVVITSITPSWSALTGYFRELTINSNSLFNSANPRSGSSQTISFAGITISAGQTVTVEINGFKVNMTGGQNVDMSNVDMTIEFSDGTVINFNTGGC